LPEAEMQVKVLWPFIEASRSPMRPPQPTRAPSGACACQVDCWSLCEKSLGGSGTERAEYCCLVVGASRGPTLATTAARPASNSPRSSPMLGCSAKLRPACAVAGENGSTPPVSAGPGRVMGDGAALRAAW